MSHAQPRIIFRNGPDLSAKLQAFEYQVEAVDAVKGLPYAAVFHEQGLGKTKIAIDVMLHWFKQDVVDTVLLVTKKTLVDNWKRELSTHSFITPRLLTANRNQNFFALNSPARVILTHFEGVKMELKRLRLLCKTRRVAAILDESARIKNPASGIAAALINLAPSFQRRLILTGTPVANRPYDLWAQIYFLDSGKSLGTSYADFKASMDLTVSLAEDRLNQTKFETELSGIFAKIKSFAVRETKASGRIDLPQKIVQRILCGWEPKQYAMYKAVRDETRLSVVKGGKPVEDDAEGILKRLLRLVQVASNPRLVDEAYEAEPGKWPKLMELVDSIQAKGEKVIVWTTFTENAEWIANRMSRDPAIIHGGLSIERRNRSINKFMTDPTCRLLVATPGAAKEGLTLTVANHVIFYDRSFSLDDYLQAQDRIHRVSQQKTCYVYNLIAQDSVDEWVDVLLQAKRTAAQLAQGDISLEQYEAGMTYSFGEALRGVLRLEKGEKHHG